MKSLTNALFILLSLTTFESYTYADEGRQGTSRRPSVNDPFKPLEFEDNLKGFSGKQVRAP